MKLSALCAYFSSIFQNNENDMPEIHVTENGVLKLLKALNISQAAGPDSIRPRVFKELSSELAPILTLLFKASMHQQSLLNIWKHANVSPIYKKGDKTNIKSEMRSFKSNENIHKKEGGSYYVVSANKASSVTL